MSLITRCPACQTLFKVVPDQLRISEGWVRCGQCAEIFDASLHLLPSSAPLAPASIAAVPEGPQFLVEEAPLAQDSFVVATPDAQAAATAPRVADELPVIDEAGLSGFQHDLASLTGGQYEETRDASKETVHQEEPALIEPLVLVRASPLSHGARDDFERETDSDLVEASFLRQKSVPATKSSLLGRATWALFGLVLTLGLAGQVALHERDRIAAFQPDLKPWLQALCEPFSCSVSPWRKIDAIVIDSSAFTRIRDDSYRLNLSLKNTATVSLALPALELTLTNSLDQPVIRRVLFFSEFDGNSDTIAAGFEQAVSLALVADLSGGADRIAGYRLLAFYP